MYMKENYAMRWNRSIQISLLLFVFGTTAFGYEPIANQKVDIQLFEQKKTITLQLTESARVQSGSTGRVLKPDVYTLSLTGSKPPQFRYHLFSKTFPPNQRSQEQQYVQDLKKRGAEPEVVVVGKRLYTQNGKVLDGTVHWISALRFSTEAAATANQKSLEEAGLWTWLRKEKIALGTGTITITSKSGKTPPISLPSPIVMASKNPIRASDVDVGFWKQNQQTLTYSGNLKVDVAGSGTLDVYEQLGIEDYLEGVLPAEMPALWPLEALKAQAVAARSEVLASLGTKHHLEGFEFCGKEHCRAYRGTSAIKPSTSQALRETRGEILVNRNKITTTVFSATCGGWTENNDTVWFGPPDDSLRGVSDVAPSNKSARNGIGSIDNWLNTTPNAYCAGDDTYFRWKRSYSNKEIHDMITQRHKVGRIRKIELGERGVSGRLKWVRIHGDSETVVVKKELPIRQLFGGLPSALFVLNVGEGAQGRTWTFTGGGRGHGVGLCQNGARGMALNNIAYDRIVQHYFSDVTLERYE
jgi:SpoIID/LytB domain protein